MFVFKRAIKKATTNINADEAIRKLESFLDENSPNFLIGFIESLISSKTQLLTPNLKTQFCPV